MLVKTQGEKKQSKVRGVWSIQFLYFSGNTCENSDKRFGITNLVKNKII